MKHKVLIPSICLIVVLLLCSCGKKASSETSQLASDNIDISRLVDYADGEYRITDACDWLSADLRFQWDHAFNDNKLQFIDAFLSEYPDANSNYHDKKYLKFLGQCLASTLTQPISPDDYLSGLKSEINGAEWDETIYRYLELIETDSGYNYTVDPRLYKLLYNEIEDGCIDISDYSDSFQGYDNRDLAMMSYIVNAVDESPGTTSSDFRRELRDHYAKTNGFLFYVYASKYVAGLGGQLHDLSNDLLFEYDVRSGTVSYIEIYDPTNSYSYKPIYALADIPDGYLDADAVAAYQTYLDENGWNY